MFFTKLIGKKEKRILGMGTLDLLDMLPVGIAVNTLDGEIVFCNKRYLEMFGYDSMQDAGSVQSQYTETDGAEREQHIRNIMSGEEYIYENSYRLKKDGTVICISGASISVAVAGVVCLMGYVIDVTESAEEEKEISQMNEELSGRLVFMKLMKKEVEAHLEQKSYESLGALQSSIHAIKEIVK